MEKNHSIPAEGQAFYKIEPNEGGIVDHDELASDRKYTILDVPKDLIDMFESDWELDPGLIQQSAKSPKPMYTNDLYALYLNDVIKTPLLTKDGETVLSQYIESGNDAKAESFEHYRKIWAKDKLVKSNLRLVVKYARKYMNDGSATNLMDIIQEATIGLDRAAEKFNWRRGFKFSTYATWWIRQAVNRYLAKETSVHMPSKRFEQIKSLTNLENSHNGRGEKPSNEYLADIMGISMDELYMLNVTRSMMITSSLDRSVEIDSGDNGSDTTLGALIGEEEPGYQIVEAKLAKDALQKILSILDDRLRGVIERRYGLSGYEPHTLEEVGKVYGLTRERVRQIENNALKKLREIEDIDELSNFLS